MVQSLAKVLFKETYIYVYALYLRKKHCLSKTDTLNFTMHILKILAWSLKTCIRLHNLISMNNFFTERSVFLYNWKETSENK